MTRPGSHRVPAVFLQHGLFSFSADWIIAGLVFHLAEVGFEMLVVDWKLPYQQ